MSAEWIGSYRLQLHAGFTLDAARRILPYLAELGVSHVYLSPCLQAVPGSQHGYDVTDPSRISDDLGGEAAWTASSRVRDRNGCESCSTSCRTTCPPRSTIRGGTMCWRTDLSAIRRIISTFEPGRSGPFAFTSARWRMPTENRSQKRRARPSNSRMAIRASSISTTAGRWVPPRGAHCCAPTERMLCRARAPASAPCAPATPSARQYRRQVARRRDDSRRCAPSRAGSSSAVDRAQARQRRLLDAVLQRQFFMLHGWKLAGELTNYRRFFDVSALERHPYRAARGVSSHPCAHRGHDRAEEQVDGLRIDHPDGLRDPLAYFKRLRALLPRRPFVRREDPGER